MRSGTLLLLLALLCATFTAVFSAPRDFSYAKAGAAGDGTVTVTVTADTPRPGIVFANDGAARMFIDALEAMNVDTKTVPRAGDHTVQIDIQQKFLNNKKLTVTQATHADLAGAPAMTVKYESISPGADHVDWTGVNEVELQATPSWDNGAGTLTFTPKDGSPATTITTAGPHKTALNDRFVGDDNQVRQLQITTSADHGLTNRRFVFGSRHFYIRSDSANTLTLFRYTSAAPSPWKALGGFGLAALVGIVLSYAFTYFADPEALRYGLPEMGFSSSTLQNWVPMPEGYNFADVDVASFEGEENPLDELPESPNKPRAAPGGRKSIKQDALQKGQQGTSGEESEHKGSDDSSALSLSLGATAALLLLPFLL